MYIHLSSKDSINSSPQNNCWDFTIDTGRYIRLEGKYEVGLSEIWWDGEERENLYIFSDIVNPSFVMDSYLPILRVTHQPKIFTRPHYMRLAQDSISQIRVYIRTDKYKKPSFTPKSLNCTLEIRRLQ